MPWNGPLPIQALKERLELGSVDRDALNFPQP